LNQSVLSKRKLIDLLLIKFLLTFNFILIQTTKDTLVISNGGAEVIPILKGGPVILVSLFFTWLYSTLSKRISRDQLFKLTLGFFIAFYMIYAFVLMPFRNEISPHESAKLLLSFLGEHRKAWVSVYENWIDTVFFIVTELWSTMVLMVSFWGFANQISSVKDAENFYGLIPLAGHISLITGGALVALINKVFDLTFYASVKIILTIFCISTSISMIIFHFSYKKFALKDDIKREERKNNRSFTDSMKQIWLNPFLRTIAIITICFSFSINMIEMGWKAYLKEFFTNPKDYHSCMGLTSSMTGLSSLLFSLIFGRSIIKKLGWYKSSQITPIVACVMTVIFSISYFANKYIYAIPLIIVILGAAHNIFLKTMKLSVFDPTKEMMYIPLDEDAKASGKAAIDVFCFRLGKSSSSWVQLFLIEFIGMGSFLNTFHIMFLIVGIVIYFWIKSLNSLKGTELI
jgi:ATP:ADP antiporter, AAA family